MSFGSGSDRYMDNPISIIDASSMLRQRIRKNERPFDEYVKRFNNKRVDEWEDKLLKPLAAQYGQLMASRIWPTWVNFNEGYELRSYFGHPELIQNLDNDLVEVWKQRFTSSSFDDLKEMGTMLVMHGWNIVISYIRRYVLRKKYDTVFSTTDDVMEWYKLHQEHKLLFEGDDLPFWTKERINEYTDQLRVLAQLNMNAFPEQLLRDEYISHDLIKRCMHQTVRKNDRPNERSYKSYHNQLLKTWMDELLPKLTKVEGRGYKPVEVQFSWNMYIEGQQLLKYFEDESLIHKYDLDVVYRWKEILERQDIEELTNLGQSLSDYGWGVVYGYITQWIYRKKYEQVYSKYPYTEWEARSQDPENKPLFEGEVLPFWEPNDLKEYNEPVYTIRRNKVEPKLLGPGVRQF